MKDDHLRHYQRT